MRVVENRELGFVRDDVIGLSTERVKGRSLYRKMNRIIPSVVVNKRDVFIGKDLFVGKDGIVINIKYSSLHCSRSPRWAWCNIFGYKDKYVDNYKYDYLLLMGERGSDKTDGLIYFVIPYDKIYDLTNKRGTSRGIDVGYNSVINNINSITRFLVKSKDVSDLLGENL